jgi:hypothetical protein
MTRKKSTFVTFFSPRSCTDKKKIFLINKEVQKGSVAKSYMAEAYSYMTKYLSVSSYIRKPFLIYDFATDPI